PQDSKYPPGAADAKFHVCVNSLADYLEIPDLCELANEELEFALQRNWTDCLASFAEIAQYAFDNSRDEDLAWVLAGQTDAHLQDLVERQDFENLRAPASFHSYLLNRLAKRLAGLEFRSAVLDLVIAKSTCTQSKLHQLPPRLSANPQCGYPITCGACNWFVKP
ncbi:hypothetical protein KEM55_001288, partial [Ascosphaera atra]